MFPYPYGITTALVFGVLVKFQGVSVSGRIPVHTWRKPLSVSSNIFNEMLLDKVFAYAFHK